MIFISGIISIIIKKNTLCKYKIRAIFLCSNYVAFLPENVHFYILPTQPVRLLSILPDQITQKGFCFCELI